jgi:uncharacterized repeat protein (TIGR01451 family)
MCKIGMRRLKKIIASFVVSLGLVLSVGLGSGFAANIAVTSDLDDGSPGTLRAAIIQANSNGEADIITISGAVGQIDIIGTALPALIEDGTEINCNNVVLNGAGFTGIGVPGLTISSSYNKIQNCTILDYSGPDILIQVDPDPSSPISVHDNEIGPDNYFSVADPSANGSNSAVFITGSSCFQNYVAHNIMDYKGDHAVKIASGAHNNFIIENAITNCSTNGIYIGGASHDNCISNNEISNSNLAGIQMDKGAYENYIVGSCSVDASHPSMTGYATGENKISQNAFGILIVDPETTQNYIQNNEIFDNGGEGIRFDNKTHHNYIGVDNLGGCSNDTGNSISANADVAISINDFSHNSIIGCNTITNNGNGILVGGGSYNNNIGPANSIIYNPLYAAGGIQITSEASGNVVHDSVIKFATLGVAVNGAATNNDIGPNNIIESCSRGGIGLGSAENNRIFNNVVSNSRSPDEGVNIYLGSSHSNQIFGNTIEIAKLYGILLNNSSDNLIESNTISDNVKAGIRIQGGSSLNNKIIENVVTNNGSDDGGSQSSFEPGERNDNYHTQGAIWLDAAQNTEILKNYVSGNHNNGIHLSNGAKGNVIGYGSSESNTITYNEGVGIYIKGGLGDPDPNDIYNNTVSYNFFDGIVLINVSNEATSDVQGNTVAGNGRHGIRCLGSSPAIENNIIVNNTVHGISVEADYGENANPASPNMDDIYSQPIISEGTIAGNGGWGVLMLDSGAENQQDIISGLGGISFSGNGEGAFSQAWYGLVYLEGYDGSPVTGAEVTISGNGTITTGSGALGLNYPGIAPITVDFYAGVPLEEPSPVDLADCRTWYIIHEFSIDNSNTVQYHMEAHDDGEAHQVTFTGSTGDESSTIPEECCYYSWDGDTDNDDASCSLAPENFYLDSANTDGHYQVAQIRNLSTAGTIQIGIVNQLNGTITNVGGVSGSIYGGYSTGVGSTADEVYFCVKDPDQGTADDPTFVEITVTTEVYGDSKVLQLQQIVTPSAGWASCVYGDYFGGPIRVLIGLEGMSQEGELFAEVNDVLTATYTDPDDNPADSCSERPPDSDSSSVEVHSPCVVNTLNADRNLQSNFALGETVLFQILNDELNLDPDAIDVITGDDDEEDPFGLGDSGGTFTIKITDGQFEDTITAGDSCDTQTGTYLDDLHTRYEPFEISETGNNTAVFEESFHLHSATVDALDCMIQAEEGDEITLTYNSGGRNSCRATINVRSGDPTSCELSFVNDLGEPIEESVINQTLYVQIDEGDQNLAGDEIDVLGNEREALLEEYGTSVIITNLTYRDLPVNPEKIPEDDSIIALETSTNSGQFLGDLRTSNQGEEVGRDDGRLYVAETHRVVAYYNDYDPGNRDQCNDLILIVGTSDSETRFIDSQGNFRESFQLETEPLCVEVFDPDQNKDPNNVEFILPGQVVITNETNGDVQHNSDGNIARMDETGTGTGRYSVCFSTTKVSEENPEIVNDDGTIQATEGDIISVTYTDPENVQDTSTAEVTIQSSANSACNFLESYAGAPLEYITHNNNIHVSIEDPDQDKSFDEKEEIRVTVSCPTTSDEEEMVLTESDVHTGIFLGSLNMGLQVVPADLEDELTPIPATPGDAQLACGMAYLVILEYTDPDEELDQAVCEARIVYENQPSQTVITDDNYRPVDIIYYGDNINVEVTDYDKNREPYEVEQVHVDLFADLSDDEVWDKSSEEGEQLEIDETGTSSGIFHGMMPTGEALVTGRKGIRMVAAQESGNGVINISLGDRVVARYQDPQDPDDISLDSALILGSPLRVTKVGNKDEVVIGDIITYTIDVENIDPIKYNNVAVVDKIPLKFAYIKGTSYILNDINDPYATVVKAPDPEWVGPGMLRYDLGTIPGQTTGRSVRRIYYQLTPSSGVKPGVYRNTAWAEVDGVEHSNRSSFEVKVTLDPIFDLSTVIGKVFEDLNGNGMQDEGEKGIPNVKVAVENGVYAITDDFGRYHIEALMPYSHVVKVDTNTLPPGSFLTTEEARVIDMTHGLLAKVNFGIQTSYDVEMHEMERIQAFVVAPFIIPQKIRVKGNAMRGEVFINDEPLPLLQVNVELRDFWEDRTVIYHGGPLGRPIYFTTTYNGPSESRRWKFTIARSKADSEGKPIPSRIVNVQEGDGKPPLELNWNGRDKNRRSVIATNAEYLFWLELWDTRTGSYARSSHRPFITRSQRPKVSRGGTEEYVSGFAFLTIDMIQKLRDIATYLRDDPDKNIVIEGHTDDIGSDEYNLKLSQRRANTVRKYMIVIEGVNEDRVTAIGYGESRPKHANDSSERRAANRRVEIKVEGSDSVFDLTYVNPQIKIRKSKRPPRREAPAPMPAPVTSPTDATTTIDTPPPPPVPEPAPQVDLVAEEDVIPVDVGGNFYYELGTDDNLIEISLQDPSGRVSEIRGELPSLEVDPPNLPSLIPETVKSFVLRGRTDPGNSITINNTAVIVAEDGSFAAEVPLSGQNIYVIKATNNAGFTVVAKRGVRLIGSRRDKSKIEIRKGVPLTVYWPPEEEVIRTSTLTIFGSSSTDATVHVNGQIVSVNEEGNFSVVVDLEDGLNEIMVDAVSAGGERAEISRDLLVDSNVFFMVGLADLEGRQLLVEGENIEGDSLLDLIQETDGHKYYNDEYYAQGRLAFYLKGKILGKYLITAALDTEKDDVEHMIAGLDETNTIRLFRELDPEEYYPVYGDESTVVDDTNSLGKFYVLVEWEKSHLTWGNYQTGMTGTEFAQYNRTIYGGKLGYESVSETQWGDPDTRLILFLADPITLQERDELRAITTKSNYNFRQADVVEGSEKVTLEVRDKISGLTVGRIPLARGKDYSVSYFFGNIILNQPVESFLDSQTIISSELQDGNETWLIIEYEYRGSDIEDLYDYSRGGRFTQQFTDYLRLGMSYIDEQGDDVPGYQLIEGDFRIQPLEKTYFYGEIAQSENKPQTIFRSYDGGYTYSSTTTETGYGYEDDESRQAYKLELSTELEPVSASVYFRRIQEGFTSGGINNYYDTDQYGGLFSWAITETTVASLLYDKQEIAPNREYEHNRQIVTAQVKQSLDYGIPWDFTLEVSYQEDSNPNLESSPGGVTDTVALGEDSDRTLGALRVDAHVTEWLTLYGRHQQTIDANSDGAPDDETYDQESLGADWSITDRTKLTTEGTYGYERGNAARILINHMLSDSMSLYTGYNFSEDRYSDTRNGSSIAGSSYSLNDKTRIWNEEQYAHGTNTKGPTSLSGADYSPLDRLTLGAYLELAHLEQQESTFDRTGFSIGAGWKQKRLLEAKTKFEYRVDRGSSSAYDDVSHGFRTREALFETRAKWNITDEYTAFGRYTWTKARTRRYDALLDAQRSITDAYYNIWTLGFAYRPTVLDWLNLIGKVSQLRRLRPESQDPMRTEQRKDIASIETIFDLNQYISLTEKIAGKDTWEQVDPLPWTKTRTILWINRLSFHVTREWDIAGEYRQLRQLVPKNQMDGFLVEVNRLIADHVRLGAGYNFSHFSDNEYKDNDYDSYGFLLRLQGVY